MSQFKSTWSRKSNAKGSLTVWHYTVVEYLAAILQDGVIKFATLGVKANEKPVVWFSSNCVWEHTANKRIKMDDGRIVSLDKERTHEEFGLARFGVDVASAPHDWSAFKKKSGIKPVDANGLDLAAKEMGGDPMEWFVSFEQVKRPKWTAVEVFNGKEWVDYRTPGASSKISLPTSGPIENGVYPIGAFMGPEGKSHIQAILDAKVILGVDVASGRQFVLFGRKFLESAARDNADQQAKIVRIKLRQETTELEMAIALIQATRGAHDYGN